MKILNKKSTTIFRKLFIPIFCLMILQSAIFYVATLYGGVQDALNKNAKDILSERVVNRKDEIQTLFNTKWSNVNVYNDVLDELYEKYKTEYDWPVYDDVNLQRAFLSEANSTLISMLRKNGVNGVFLILNNQEKYTDITSGRQEKYGICIRDYDINSGYTNKEDLLVERCPSTIISNVGCSLDSWWEATYQFEQGKDEGDYFYEPLKAAYDNPSMDNDNLTYFDGIHNYGGNDQEVVSYSIPLIDSEGYPYGVLGIELTVKYLESLLPSEELQGQNQGSYILVQYQEGDESAKIVSQEGALSQRVLGDSEAISIDNIKDEKEFEYTADNVLLCGTVSDLKIYNSNTLHENEKLALIGIVEKKVLFRVSDSVKKTLFIASILVLAVGCLGIFFISHLLTQPIKRLSQKVRAMKPDGKIQLERLEIDEIDQLVSAIEGLSKSVNETQARTEFFSQMSHDMRTPMNAIIGFSSHELLENASEVEKDRYLEQIHASGSYLLTLINEVLDMTKINSGKMELHEEVIRADEFWKKLIPMIKKLADMKNVHFITEIPEDANSVLICDQQKLSQVVVNLLSNAVKFTDTDGTVWLRVKERVHEGSIDYRIEVKDNGIGMSEEFQQKLYEPFAQEHSEKEGTGLGLSITKQIVLLMDGEIDCISAEGEGTEFVVDLTCKRQLVMETDEDNQELIEDAQDDEEKSEEELHRILHGKRVLLCEDHPLNQKIAKKILEKQGIIVDIAEDGKEGVSAFQKSEVGYYAAVLMDIRMPVLDGLEATKVIRNLPRDDAKRVPVIALTANAFVENLRESKSVGMNDHLSKPIEPQKLYQTLAKYVE